MIPIENEDLTRGIPVASKGRKKDEMAQKAMRIGYQIAKLEADREAFEKEKSEAQSEMGMILQQLLQAQGAVAAAAAAPPPQAMGPGMGMPMPMDPGMMPPPGMDPMAMDPMAMDPMAMGGGMPPAMGPEPAPFM